MTKSIKTKSPAFQKKQKGNNSLKTESNYTKYFLPLAIVVSAIVFINILTNDFAGWDDSVNILDNPIIKQFNGNTIKEIFFNFHGTDFPLTIFSYSIEFKLFGLNPFYFHLTNYFLHLLNVILVYILIKRISGKPLVAFITSLFFGIHPMHVESVAWISERKDVLYSFFFLLSLNSYCKYLFSKKKNSFLFWSLIWFFLSMMSKPAAACLPLVLILLDHFIDKKITARSLVLKIPFFAIVLFFGIVTLFIQKSFDSFPALSQSYNILDRVFLFSYSTIYYIFKAIVPLQLCVIHFYPVKTGGTLPIGYYLSLPALLLLIWIVIRSKLFKNEIIFGLLFYFITIIMVLQIIPTGQQALVSERYSYIPYIGLFFIVGIFFSYVFDKNNSVKESIKIIFKYAIVIFSIAFCYLTLERNKVWKNGIVLFTDEINKYPEQGYSWFGRGFCKNEKCDYNGAIADFNEAIEKYSFDPEFYFNRGNVYNSLNKFDKAVNDYSSAIKLKPNYAEAFNNRGASYGNMNLLDESLNDFNKAISLKPKYAESYFGRGLTKYNMNDTTGACADWLTSQHLGYENANEVLEKYCK